MVEVLKYLTESLFLNSKFYKINYPMFLKLVAKFKELKHSGKNSSHFYILGNILYYKNRVLCKFKYKSEVQNEKLYIFRDNIIEEYEIPYVDKYHSKCITSDGNVTNIYFKDNNLICDKNEIYCMDKPRDLLISENFIFIVLDSKIIVLDHSLSIQCSHSYRLYEFSKGNLLLLNDDLLYFGFNGKQKIDCSNISVKAIFDFYFHSNTFFLWTLFKEMLEAEEEDIYEDYKIESKLESLHLKHDFLISDGIWTLENDLKNTSNSILFDKKYEEEYKSTEYLVCYFGQNQKRYYKEGKLIFFLNGVYVVLNQVKISKIRFQTHIEVGDKILNIIITDSCIFLIYKNIIAYKYSTDIIYDIERFNLKTLNGCYSIYSMYLCISLFADLSIDIWMPDLEKFLFDLFIYTSLGDDFIKKIYHTLKNYKTDHRERFLVKIETILCDLFRKVDDKNKTIIEKYIRNIKSLENLKKMIIYRPKQVMHYIERCVLEDKEFEILELIEHYKDESILSQLGFYLLEKNLFFLFTACFPEFKDMFDNSILKIEEYNLRTQKKYKEYLDS